ncbi:MAG: rRNA maturation RNase YbeY [Gammaproteobacteria bacterium]|nr:rRNA maturation RNase YbeY [Gammaproteobacteria bacterium]
MNIQIACEQARLPDQQRMAAWASVAMDAVGETGHNEITLRVVDEAESAELNQRYRDKPGATNVLSFPFDDPPGVATQMLGDLVICAPVVEQQAVEQGKSLDDHWAHIIVHGVLHLRGYDHEQDGEATKMEQLEKEILDQLGIPDPY